MLAKYLPPPESRGRILRFLVVGGGSAGVQFGVLALIEPHFSASVAYCISWVLGTTAHYLANRFWALPSARHDTGKQFGEYLFTIAVSFVINFAAFRFFLDIAGLSVKWATFWAIPPSMVVVFLLLNYRVFRASPASK